MHYPPCMRLAALFVWGVGPLTPPARSTTDYASAVFREFINETNCKVGDDVDRRSETDFPRAGWDRMALGCMPTPFSMEF